MRLIADRPNIGSPEWHGTFIHISQYDEIWQIEEAVTDIYKNQEEEEIEIRVYNESSTFKTFTPDEKNHIGFVRCQKIFPSNGSGDWYYKIEHLTADRQLASYMPWDACKFYRGEMM